MKALVISEHNSAAALLCAGARGLADEVVLAVLGEAPTQVADKAYSVIVPDNRVADDAYATIQGILDTEKPEIVIAEPTRHARSIVGRLAAAASTAVITDVLNFEEAGARSMYFGGVAERVRKPQGTLAFYTVAPNVFGDAAPMGSDVVESVAWVEPAGTVEKLESTPIEKSGVDLTSASVVVSAGRGFSEESELDLARALCDKLGAGLACSRPLTEGVNWLPTETYVGVSGLNIAPKLYIAAGISGQMQHMVGCNRSETIVAINKDKNAPIFKQCDFGLIGDIKTILPALVEAL